MRQNDVALRARALSRSGGRATVGRATVFLILALAAIALPLSLAAGVSADSSSIFTYSASSNPAIDAYSLRLNGADLQIVDTAAPDTVLASQPLAEISRIRVAGEDDQDDTLTVDFSGGFFTVPDGIEFDGAGGDGYDTLALAGDQDGLQSGYLPDGSDSSGYSGTLSVDSLSDHLDIEFSGLEPIDILGPVVTLTIYATDPATTMTVTADSEWYTASFAGVFETLRWKNATNVVFSISAANLVFTVNVPSKPVGDSLASLTVNGGVDNVFNVVATPAGVATTVNGRDGDDIFNVGGGVQDAIAGPLTLNGDNGADTFNLGQGTIDVFDNTLTANGGAGDDTFNVGQGSLRGYPTSFSVDGAADTDSVTFDNSSNAGVTWVMLSATVLRYGSVDLSYANMEDLTYQDGASTNEISITGTHTGQTIVKTGGGDDAITLSDCSGPVTVSGGAGSYDDLTLPVPAGADETVTVDGDTIATTYFSGTVTYDTIEWLRFDGSANNETFDIVSTPADVTTEVEAAGGDDVFNVGNGVSGSIAGALALYGQTGSDTFNLGEGTLDVFSSYVQATGGDGDDTFNIGQGLLDGSPTWFGVEGDGGSDSVVFDDSDNTTRADDMVSATYVYRAYTLLLNYWSMEYLTYKGGSGDDSLYIAGTHSGQSTIETGAGDDSVSLVGFSGPVSVNGQAGTDDQFTISLSTSAGGSWTLGAGTVASTHFTPTVTYDATTLEHFSILAGIGPDSFVVNAPLSATEIYLYGNAPAYTSPAPWDSVSCPGTMTVLGAYYGKFSNAGFGDVYYEAIEVTPVPLVVPTADPTTADEGQDVAFTGTVYDSDSTSWTFAWDFGDGTTSAAQSPTHAYADNGTYTATFTATDGDSNSDSDTVEVTVGNVAPTVDAGLDLTAIVGEVLTFDGGFTDPGSGDTHTIDWTFGDGGTASGTLTPTHAFTAPGIYTVTLTVTDDEGGTNSDTLTVTVVDARAMRQQAIGLLGSTLSSLSSVQLRAHAYELQALSFLQRGSSYYLDGIHLRESTGSAVFVNDKRAVALLRTAVANGRLDPVIGSEVIRLIVEADRLLAAQAIDEAKTAGGNASLIAQAEAKLAAGDSFAAGGRPDLAVEAYGAAWGLAVRAY